MVVRVKLIVTGDMEARALPQSLQQYFPRERDGDDVIWERARKLPCATSHRLSADSTVPSQPMLALARAMLDEAIDGKRGEPADLVVVIDDVEIFNLGREATIANHFRAAVALGLDQKASSQATRERYCQRIKERCSFHVLRPMVEAYLFGDPLALARTGVTVAPSLRHATDVEEFEAVDGDWLQKCQLVNHQQNAAGRDWWRDELHPKRYLAELIARSGRATYDETIQGADALQGLNWVSVPKVRSDVAFARALFEDLADWFDVASPISGTSHPVFYPPVATNRDSLVLRNL